MPEIFRPSHAFDTWNDLRRFLGSESEKFKNIEAWKKVRYSCRNKGFVICVCRARKDA